MRVVSSILFLIFFVSCTRPQEDTPGTDPITSENNIPSSVTTNTGLTIYIDYENIAIPGILSANYGTLSFPRANDCYSSDGLIQTDKYKSSTVGIVIGRNTDNASTSHRFFPVGASLYNYADTRRSANETGGQITSSGALGWVYGLFPPGPGPDTGEKLHFGPGSFTTDDFVTYQFFNPTHLKYSISLPDMTADYNNKRWLLKSFGAYSLETPPMAAAGSPVYLEYPIPVNLLAEASDSVELWFSDGGSWSFNGFAKKINNSYKAKINKAKGVWCFAKPVKGLYKKISLKTDQGVPVTNALFRVMSGAREIWSGRTDADGNSVCFLPVNEQLSVQILFDWTTASYGTFAFTLPVESFSDSREIPLTVPSNSNKVITLKGSLSKCAGSSVNEGLIKIIRYEPKKTLQAYLPVKNGQLTTAFLIPGYGASASNPVFLYIARAADVAGGQQGSDTVLYLSGATDNVVAFSSCPLPANLYANYTIDGISYSIAGDTAHFAAPALYANGSGNPGNPNGNTYLVCSNNGQGFELGINLATAGTNPNAVANSVFVNNVLCNFFEDGLRHSSVTFSRYDVPGGYIVGNASIYYKDNTGNVHHLVTNFKLKRLS